MIFVLLELFVGLTWLWGLWLWLLPVEIVPPTKNKAKIQKINKIGIVSKVAPVVVVVVVVGLDC